MTYSRTLAICGTVAALLLIPACSGGPGVEPEPELVKKEVVFFASSRSARPGTTIYHGMDVWVMNTDGSNPRQVTHFAEGDYWPSDVSPDGRTLLFYRLDAWTFVSGLYTLNLTDPEAQPKRLPLSGLVNEGTFFPDGERLLFSGFVPGSDGENYQSQIIYDLRDGSTLSISPDRLPSSWGRLSPDGSKMCYAANREYPSVALFVESLDGSSRRALTPEEDSNVAYHCAFTPSGQELVLNFDAAGQNGLNLYRANFATGERRVIRAWAKPGDIDYHAFPSVDSLGARVYVRVNGGHRPDSLSEIASVGLDGSAFRLLTQDRHLDDTPVVANAYVWEMPE